MDCIDIYVKKILEIEKKYNTPPSQKIDAAEQTKTDINRIDEIRAARQIAIERIQKVNEILQAKGKKFEDINPNSGISYGDEIINSELNIYILGSDIVPQSRTTLDAVDDFVTKRDALANTIRLAYPKMSEKNVLAEATQALLVDTNYSYGYHSLETLTVIEKQSRHGEFYNRLEQELPNFKLETELLTETFRRDFIDEYINMAHIDRWEKQQNISITKNETAHKVARIFIEEAIQLPNLKLVAAGRENRSLFANKMRVEMTPDLVKEKFKTPESFADFMLQHIDTAPLEKRYLSPKQLMISIYDGLLSGKIKSWREIDNFLKKQDELTNAGQISTLGGLEYKSGIDFRAVNDAIGYTKDISQLMLNTMQYNSQIVALTKMFGPKYWQGFEQIKKLVTDRYGKNLEALDIGTRTQIDGIFTIIDHKINPDIMERSGFVPAFTIAKRLQAISKLGTVLLTSMMDAPIFIFTGRTMFGNDLGSLYKAVFNVIPFVHNRQEQMKFATYFLEFSDSWLNSARDMVSITNPSSFNALRGGTALRSTANFSSWYNNKIFQLSGFNYWTRNLQAGAAGVYVKSFGRLIKGENGEQVAWTALHPRFRAQLMRYGVDENDWAFLLKHQPLDATGRLDMYKLGRLELLNSDKVVRESPIQQKIIAAVSDAVNTMVVKPGEFDRSASAFFQDDSKLIGQMMTMITQFKSQPLSYTRKVFMRQFHRKLYETAMPAEVYGKMEKIMDFTALAGGLLIVSALQLQLKQVVAGKNTYQMNSPTFWLETLNQSGITGLYQDFFFQLGGKELLAQMTSEDPESVLSSAEKYDRMLGPILADAQKLMDGVGRTAQGGVRYYKGIDDGDMLQTGVGSITSLLASYSGAKNLIWTKMIYRKYMTEFLGEWFNADAYERSQKRAQSDADENRKGKPNNWIFEQLP